MPGPTLTAVRFREKQWAFKNAKKKRSALSKASNGSIFVVGILASAFLFALDSSIVADVQLQIIETSPGNIDKLPWLSVAFAFGAASATLVG